MIRKPLAFACLDTYRPFCLFAEGYHAGTTAQELSSGSAGGQDERDGRQNRASQVRWSQKHLKSLYVLNFLCRTARTKRKVKIKEQAKDLRKSLEETNFKVEKTLHPVERHKVTFSIANIGPQAVF